MSSPIHTTPHPSDETLAAFTENRLDPAARRTVIEHMTVCADCRSGFLLANEMAAAEEPRNVPGIRTGSRSRQRAATVAGLSALATAAMISALLFLTPLRKRFAPPPKSGIPALVEATQSLEYRPIEGRLSGGFAYKPMKPPEIITRGKAEVVPGLSADELPLAAAAGPLVLRARSEKTPDTLHAAGAAQLLLGKFDEAVASLSDAVRLSAHRDGLSEAIRACNDAALLNDLAAAFIARSRGGTTATDVLFAVDAAVRAYELRPEAETAWNRAVAVSLLHLDDRAAQAWSDYLRFDSTSSWAKEATARRREHHVSGSASKWPAAQRALNAALHSDDQIQVDEIARLFPLQTREWVEESAFAAWAEAIQARDDLLAQRRWILLSRSAAATAKVAADALAQDELAAIHTRSHAAATLLAIAAAHHDFAVGRELYKEAKASEAKVLFRRAESTFRRYDLPFAVATALANASCDFLLRDFAQTSADLARVFSRDDLVTRYPSAAGRAHWLAALVESETGDPRLASDHYRRAVGMFVRTREDEYWAASSVQLAQTLDELGLPELSWGQRFRAFSVYPNIVSARWRHGVAIEAVMAAVRDGHLQVAELMLDTATRTDAAANDEVGSAAVYRWRSMVSLARGDLDAAGRAIAHARHHAGRIDDEALRRSAVANIDVADAIRLAHDRPKEALALLARAEPSGTFEETARATLFRTRAMAASGSGATAPVIHALDVLEARLGTDATALAFKSPLYTRPLTTLYDEVVLQLANQGDAVRSLALAQRARATMRRLNGAAADAHSAAHLTSSSATVLAYYVLPEALISWSVHGGATVCRVDAGGVEKLHRAAAELRNPRARAGALRRLYALLVEPHEQAVRVASVLYVVPDELIWEVPVAALEARDHRPLVSTHAVIFASSADTTACDFHVPRDGALNVIIAANPDSPELPSLKNARGEAARVAAILRRTGARIHERSGSLTRDVAESADVLHFAAHAIVDRRNPTDSYLATAITSGGLKVLDAGSIRRLRFRRHPLVVLAACETAVKRPLHLDGSASLAEAFDEAGAAVIIATTARVPDAASDVFFEQFYGALAGGSDPPQALRAAQLYMIRNRFPDETWSGYVCLATA
ncbi:MAG TPA: CHAT domain-containing protein [Thermoanaerobaculia bacterium]|jgi:hypothetical protein